MATDANKVSNSSPNAMPPHKRKAMEARQARAGWEHGGGEDMGSEDARHEQIGVEGHKALKSTTADPTPADANNREHPSPFEQLAPETDSANLDAPKDFREDFEGSQHAQSNGQAQRTSFETLLNMDVEECSKQMSNVAEKRSQRVESDDETAPPLANPAERYMSIEELKRLRNTGMLSGTRDGFDNDLYTRIDEANRVISGRSRLHAPKPPTPVESPETIQEPHTDSKIQIVSSLPMDLPKNHSSPKYVYLHM